MSSLFSFFWSGLNWQPAAAFCFVGCFWGPGYSKCSNHIWIVLSESWCGGTGCTAVSQLGVELSLGCSEGGEKVGSKGCASSSCAKQALPEVGASSEQPPHRLVWWSFVQKKCVCLVRVFNVLVFIQALCVWRWPQVLASPCGVCSCPPARIDIFPPPWWSECSWSSAAGEAQDFSRKSKCPKLFDNNYLKCSVKALNLPSQWLSSGPCNKKCIFLRTYSLGNRLWYCICN